MHARTAAVKQRRSETLRTLGPKIQEPMSRASKAILALFVISLAAGTVFVLTYEMPRPSSAVEKVIPNERFSP